MKQGEKRSLLDTRASHLAPEERTKLWPDSVSLAPKLPFNCSEQSYFAGRRCSLIANQLTTHAGIRQHTTRLLPVDR